MSDNTLTAVTVCDVTGEPAKCDLVSCPGGREIVLPVGAIRAWVEEHCYAPDDCVVSSVGGLGEGISVDLSSLLQTLQGCLPMEET